MSSLGGDTTQVPRDTPHPYKTFTDTLRLTDPARVFAFHRRFDAMGVYARWLLVGVEAAIVVALAGVVGVAFVAGVVLVSVPTKRFVSA